MPLMGLRDVTGTCLTFAEIERLLAEHGGRKQADQFGVSADMIREIVLDHNRPRREAWRHVTELVNDPLTVRLQREKEYYVEPSALLSRLRGTLLHREMAPHWERQGITTEVPVEAWVWDGRTVCGTVDCHQRTWGIIDDLKSTSKGLAWTVTYPMNPAYAMQLQIYAMMLRDRGHIIHRGHIIMMALPEEGWPRDVQMLPRVYLPVDLDIGLCKKVFDERVEIHRDADKLPIKDLPQCDTWRGKRCKKYCDVTGVCPHMEKEEANE